MYLRHYVQPWWMFLLLDFFTLKNKQHDLDMICDHYTTLLRMLGHRNTRVLCISVGKLYPFVQKSTRATFAIIAVHLKMNFCNFRHLLVDWSSKSENYSILEFQAIFEVMRLLCMQVGPPKVYWLPNSRYNPLQMKVIYWKTYVPFKLVYYSG